MIDNPHYGIEEILACKSKPPYLADKESFEEHAVQAGLSGKQVLVATDYQLFLDLDFELVSTLKIMFNDRSVTHDIINDVLESNQVAILKREFTRSSSGNIHGVLILNQPLEEPVRIALEVSLGSDSKRGALNAIRYSLGLRGVSRLFRPLPLKYIEV